MEKAKYVWTHDEQLEFETIMDTYYRFDTEIKKMLSTGDLIQVRALGDRYSSDEILGFFWNYIERNHNNPSIDALVDQLIDIEPRLVCEKLAILGTQHYPLFRVIINRGYVIDDNFVKAFISLIENLLEFNSIEDGLNILDRDYKEVIDYLVKAGHLDYDKLLNDTVYKVNRECKIEKNIKT